MKNVSNLLIALCAAAGVGALGTASAYVASAIWTWLGFAGFAYILWLMNMVITLILAAMAAGAAYVWASQYGGADLVAAKCTSIFGSVRARFA